MNYDFSPRNSPILPDLRTQPSTLTQNNVVFNKFVIVHERWGNVFDKILLSTV